MLLRASERAPRGLHLRADLPRHDRSGWPWIRRRRRPPGTPRKREKKRRRRLLRPPVGPMALLRGLAKRQQPLRARLADRHQQPALLRLGEIFRDEVVAAAMIDRLVHHAEILSLKGDSYRLRDRDLGGPRTRLRARNGLANQSDHHTQARWTPLSASSPARRTRNRRRCARTGAPPSLSRHRREPPEGLSHGRAGHRPPTGWRFNRGVRIQPARRGSDFNRS
jgi:IstB-like ATP binding protein